MHCNTCGNQRNPGKRPGFYLICRPCYNRKYRLENADKIKEYRLKTVARKIEIDKLYRENNKAKRRANKAKRKAQKLRATPKWANQVKISIIYEAARKLEQAFGVQYQVDHIVPLVSPFVSGLHCEANLRIVTREVNCAKSNLYWPDMQENLTLKDFEIAE
jgi:5-methylcytosine-specific restriction endonuclease McrA